MKLLLTGGCGFIGSAVIRHAIGSTSHEILNIDNMTYAASEAALEGARTHRRHRLVVADIADAHIMRACFQSFAPDAVMHLAAERHADRSIAAPFSEASRYNRSNPYSASKAASGNLVRGWGQSYGLPEWYLTHRSWWMPIRERKYRGQRLGEAA